jgi:superfamily II DNA/RNA helicase
VSSESVGFRDLGVSDEVVQALASRGILAPFPIQSMVWEDARAGRDTLARSKTGSGKTLGFAIPIAERLDPDAQPLPAALVLVPTGARGLRGRCRREGSSRAGGLRRDARP